MSQFNGRRINPPDSPPRAIRKLPKATPEERARCLELSKEMGATDVMRKLGKEYGWRRNIDVIREWIREGEKE